jgi:hypothetical protein
VQKIIIILSILLGACATPKFEPLNLTPDNIPQANQTFDAEIKNTTVTLAAKDVQTGEIKVQPDFLTLWKESLQISLDRAGFFKDDSKRKINIEAHVKKFDFNPVGLSNEIDVEVVYKIIDRSTKKVVFEHNTVTSAKMSASDVWVASERLRRIWSSATQESIFQFVAALDNAKF